MRQIRSRGGKGERLMEGILVGMGTRYIRQDKTLAGRPDFTIPSAKVAIFVDGDLWHGNPSLRLGLKWAAMRRAGETRKAKFWESKIRRNRARDRAANRALKEAGWLVLRFWEKALLAQPEKAKERVEKCLARRSPTCAAG